MKSALIAALVSAVVASGSAVAATKLIDGNSIRDHTIPAKKLTDSAISSLRGMRGPRGATGPTGPAGPQGPPGSTFTLVRGPNVDVSPGLAGTSTALCPPGSGAVGGGFIKIAGGVGYVQVSAPDTSDGTTADGWGVSFINPDQNNNILTFHAWAACANQTIQLTG